MQNNSKSYIKGESFKKLIENVYHKNLYMAFKNAVPKYLLDAFSTDVF